jgi:hypothetical protein
MPLGDMGTERGPGVIGGLLGITMLDRIVMDVIEMPVEIILVADYVIPEAPLPNHQIVADATQIKALTP